MVAIYEIIDFIATIKHLIDNFTIFLLKASVQTHLAKKEILG